MRHIGQTLVPIVAKMTDLANWLFWHTSCGIISHNWNFQLVRRVLLSIISLIRFCILFTLHEPSSFFASSVWGYWGRCLLSSWDKCQSSDVNNAAQIHASLSSQIVHCSLIKVMSTLYIRSIHSGIDNDDPWPELILKGKGVKQWYI